MGMLVGLCRGTVMNTPQTMDITKVPIATWETVIMERIRASTETQHMVNAIENDGKPDGTDEKRLAVKAVLPPELSHLFNLVNTNEHVQKMLHGGAHELIDGMMSTDAQEHSPCKYIIQAECQMILLGWKLACAYIECESLKHMT